MRAPPLRRRPIVLACLLALCAPARGQTAPTALPTGASVANGAVTLQQNAATLRVTQTSAQAIVNWSTFNIGRDAAVQFVQPSASASILNRVASGPSDIAGSLTSNGRVYLINPNGVLFSPSARVDVGSLVAAAGSMSDASFLSGAAHIAGTGALSNAGSLTAGEGGSVVLAGASVSNSGTVSAPHGAISLAAGDAIRVNLTDDGLIQAQLTVAAPQSAVRNSGLLQSEGGNIALAASAGAGGAGGLVVNTGIIRAGAVRTNGGTVSLVGGRVEAGGSIDTSSTDGDAGNVAVFGDLDAGSVALTGSIDARGGGAGGQVETSSAHVQVGADARVSTLSRAGRHGAWLIDPQDYTIGTAAGDDISGQALSANLNLGNVTIQSSAGARSGSGAILVNAPVSWSANTTLSLNATGAIVFAPNAPGADVSARNLNAGAPANLTATGDTAGLALRSGTGYFPNENKLTLSGATPSVTIDGAAFTVINARSAPLLDTILRTNLAGNYVFTDDINASATAQSNGGAGWLPLGSTTAPFSGQLHGFGHDIVGLTINRPNAGNVGLIGALTGTVRDLGLLDPHIVGLSNTGALVGAVRYLPGTAPLISHSHVAGGSVSGTDLVGGLVGTLLYSGTLTLPAMVIDSSYTSGVAISGNTSVGPLLGGFGLMAGNTINNSFYNADDAVNSALPLNVGAIFGGQFGAWLAGGRKLRIADYAASLPFDSASGRYQVSTVQGLRDLLGFASAGVKVGLANNLDLANAPGLYLPMFNGDFDGGNHSIANLNLDFGRSVASAGLVGANTGSISNIDVLNARINGSTVGGVAGANYGSIVHASVSGVLSGIDGVGGVVGAQVGAGALLADSVSTASITAASSSYGGVIGDFDSGTLRNTHYNVDTVLVNGGASLTMGGLRTAQYTDWLSHGRVLDIASYGDVLPRDAASGAYQIAGVGGLVALLGFVDQPGLTFRLTSNIDLAGSPGLYLPYLMGTLDGAGHTISNPSVVTPNLQYRGLVGVNYGTVRNLGVVNGNFSGLYYVGGLVGRNQAGAHIDDSFSSGSVTTGSGAGGLAGANFGDISNSYSSASVTTTNAGASTSAGGLAGQNVGTITNSLATGIVSGNGGGLVGNGAGTVTNSFWNTQTSGVTTSKGGTGKTSAELQSLATYTGWDFANSWRMVDGTPSLRPFTAGQYTLFIQATDLNLIYGAGPVTAAMLGVTSSGLQGGDTLAALSGTLAYSGSALGAINAGSYSALPGGLTSTKYDVAYRPGAVNIGKAVLALTAINQSKVYGDADPVLSYSVNGLKYQDAGSVLTGVSLATAQGAAAGAGSHPITISGGTAANYTVGSATPGVLTVLRSPLVVSADDKAMALGVPVPALTYSVAGLRYADSPALVTGVSLAVDGASEGVHAIVASGGSAGPNYTVSDVNGRLNVGPPSAPPVATQSLELVVLAALPSAARADGHSEVATVAAVVGNQRKALFAPADAAITRNPAIANLKECGESDLGDCIAKPRAATQVAQVSEDLGAAAPAMQIRRTLALVIGNNSYHSPLASLTGAGNDARDVANALRQQGYQVDQLANADRHTMIAALNRLIRDSTPDDSVIVYYAGHGYIHPGSSVGFWIPTDATIDDPRGWLSNVDIAHFLANVPARQQLLVSDSCFSGALTREGEASASRAGMNRNAILMRRSVVAMSSGGEEPVADDALDGHSPFTYHLLRLLRANQGEIAAKEMFAALREAVAKDATQVPAYGTVLSSGHASGGEYLLNPQTK